MGKSIIKNILIMMIVVFLGFPVYADVLGTTTTYGFFYLPAYGEFGEDAFDEYNLYMEKADNQIEASKEITDLIAVPDAIGKILETYEDEKDDYKIKFKYISTPVDTDTTYSAGTGMQLNGTTFNCTVTDTNTTYTAGTGLSLTDTTFALDANIDDLKDVDTTGNSEGKLLKFNSAGNLVVADDEDTTYSAGTGITISSGTISSSITQYTDALARTAIANEGYIKNITGENLDSLKDVPSHPEENDQILLTTYTDGVKGYRWGDAPESGNFATKSDGWISIYCDYENGSDIDGDGSSGNPYKTLQHAWNSLPDVLSGYSEISILSDEPLEEYEDVYLKGKVGALVIIKGNYQNPPTITGGMLYIENSVYLQAIKFKDMPLEADGVTFFNVCKFENTELEASGISIKLSFCEFKDCEFGIKIHSGMHDIYSNESTFINCIDNILNYSNYTANIANDGTTIDTTGKEEGKTLIFDEEGNLVVGEGSFSYNPSIANESYSGIPDIGTVGEAVVFGDLLYFKWSDKKYYKAKGDSPTTAEVVAMAVEAKSANNSCVIIRQGYVLYNDFDSFTGSIVYLSTATAGKMQSSVPNSSGDQIKRVGQAVDSKIMFFNPSQDIGEVK